MSSPSDEVDHEKIREILDLFSTMSAEKEEGAAGGEANPVYTRKGRGRLKYALTVSIGKLHTMLGDARCTPEIAKDLMTKVGENFVAFSAYHLKLHETFSPAAARVSTDYFREAKKEHDRVVKLTLHWINCKRENVEYRENAVEEDEEEEIVDVEEEAADLSETATDKPPDESKLDFIVSRLSAIEAYMSKNPLPSSSTPFKKPAEPRPTPSLSRIDELRENPDVRTKASPTPHPVPAGDTPVAANDTVVNAIMSMAESFERIASTSLSRSEATGGSKEISYKLPKFKLYHFSGDAIDYWPFIKAFETQVTTHCSDPGTLLGVLMYYTPDHIQAMLRCCTLRSNPAEAYRRARQLLDERYGNYEDVAQAWLSKFVSIPEVKSAAELLTLLTLLINCQETLMSVDQIQEFETKSTLTSIVRKLPVSLRNRWQSKVIDVSEDKGRKKLRLNDLIEFLNRVYREVSDPHYLGDVFAQGGGKEARAADNARGPKRSYAIQGETSGPSGRSGNRADGGQSSERSERSGTKSVVRCILCKVEHPTFRCDKFLHLDVEQRNQIVRSSGVCINCFHPFHKVRECKSRFSCKKCDRKHHTLLHFDRGQGSNSNTNLYLNAEAPEFIPQAQQSSYFYSGPGGTQDVRAMEGNNPASAIQPYVSATQPTVTSPYVAHAQLKGKITLPIVAVLVEGKGGERIRTYAMLDTGSTCTMITNGLIDRLRLPYREFRTTLTTVNQSRVPITCRRVDLRLYDCVSQGAHMLADVTGRPDLYLSTASRASACDVTKWPHLRDILISDVGEESVELLIGQDHPDLLLPLETRPGKNAGEPYGVRTRLGWYVSGPMGPRPEDIVSCYTDEGDLRLQEKIDAFIESDGLQLPPSKLVKEREMSLEDRKVIELWTREKKVVNGRYVMPIPFKEEEPNFPDNYSYAVRRLIAQGRRFKKDPDYFKKYVKEIQSYRDLGHAEDVDTSQDHLLKGWIFYLNHHGVDHPRKPGRLRVVHGCNGEWLGVSLNSKVYQGPDLLNRLIDIMIRICQNRVLTWGDIVKMFNQILVTLKHRNVLRFLWWEKNEVGGKIIVLRMTTHLFGGVWSPSCANFVLLQVVKDYGYLFTDPVCRMIKHEFYVDDGMKASNDGEEAVETTLGVKKLLAMGSFDFAKLMSNDPEVVLKLPHNPDWDNGDTLENIKLELAKVHHLLGSAYVPERDKFVFRPVIKEKQPSRRGVLSAAASVFDPLGLVSPVVMRAKMIFQEACRQKLPWDQLLKGELLNDWEHWVVSLDKLEEVEFDRCLLPEGVTLADEGLEFELHFYSDASKRGYGSAVFLLTLISGVPRGVSLIMAKGKLAPLKTQTIPRLELFGAHLSVQLLITLQNALSIPIRRNVFHVDSTIVLCYVNNTSARFPTLEANRLSFIHEHTVPSQWHYVPTDLNPADIVSRGCSPAELVGNGLWSNGPAYLMQGEESWPTIPENVLKKTVKFDACPDPERLLCDSVLLLRVVSTSLDEEPARKLIEHFGSWYRMRRAVVYIMKLVQYRVEKGRGVARKPTMGDVTVKMLDEVGESILRYDQRRISTECTPNQKKQYKKLYPTTEKGLLRVGGRLSKSDLHPDAKSQIVVPAGHVADVLIREAHLRTVHGGSLRTLEELQKKYWIIRARRSIRSLVNACLPCRKRKAPLLTPPMKELPEGRVVGEKPPFSEAGVDYFGPIIVRKGRTDHKRYGCMITCFLTRAVHIELAWSLDMSSCISAIFRFAGRRGMPQVLWSDNGKNFVGTNRALVKMMAEWNMSELSTIFLKEGCEWRFNVPGASHQGGVWERQIRTAREILLTLSNSQKLTDEGLLTLFVKVEDVMNSRPITEVSSDPEDLRALTPNSILRPGTPNNLPPGIFTEKDRYQKQWRQVQYMIDLFWKRWKSEYLPRLQLRVKWYDDQRSLKVGDLVILKDEMTPRNYWPMARVLEVYPDAKGVVRSVKVKTSKGEYKRPVQKMCLLEGLRS